MRPRAGSLVLGALLTVGVLATPQPAVSWPNSNDVTIRPEPMIDGPQPSLYERPRPTAPSPSLAPAPFPYYYYYGPRTVFVPGGWYWNGFGWVWVPGYWATVPY